MAEDPSLLLLVLPICFWIIQLLPWAYFQGLSGHRRDDPIIMLNKIEHFFSAFTRSAESKHEGKIMRLSIEQEDILYRNPSPGMRAECAFFPNIVPLKGDEVLCIYRIGQAFYSNHGKLSVLRSSDGGTQWASAGLLWDPADDPHPYNYFTH
jgi:hypothetical protein